MFGKNSFHFNILIRIAGFFLVFWPHAGLAEKLDCTRILDTWIPNTKTLDDWTEIGTKAVIDTSGSTTSFPPSIRPVSKVELIKNEIFFSGFLTLNRRFLKPSMSGDSKNWLDTLANALERIRESAFYVFFRGSVFQRLSGLILHPDLKNEFGRRDLRQFSSFHKDFKNDILTDATTYGSIFFDREVIAQGTVNSFAIKLFAWMNGRKTVPDRMAVNSISLLHPLVDAAMDKGWMRPDTFTKLNEYLFSGKRPSITDDYEHVLFDYLFRFEKPFPRESVPGFWFSLGRLFKTQISSLKQKKSQMALNEYYRIALDKGGLSTVLAAYTALGPLSAKQYEFFYRTGGVFQIIDDLLDIQKDQAEGVRTVWTDSLAAKKSLSSPLRQLFALERVIEDELPRMTSDFLDPSAFSNVYSFGFKLSLMRGLARQQKLIDPDALNILSGRLSLSLGSLRQLMSMRPSDSQNVQEGSDIWLLQELVQATEEY